MCRRVLNGGDVAFNPLDVELSAPTITCQQLRRAAQRGHRVAQLMTRQAEELIARTNRLAGFGVQPGVVHRQRRATADFLHQRQVFRCQAAPGQCRREQPERADRSPARLKRHVQH
jgi:hypothetical protein